MKKYTLQFRMTAAVGLVLIAACLLLTMNSLYSAKSYYGDYARLIEEGMVEYDPALSEEARKDKAEQNEAAEQSDILDQQDFYREVSRKFSVQSVLAMVFIVLLGLVITYRAAGKMLRPLKKLTQSVEHVDERNLDQRVPLEGTQGEVLVLAESFNHMLERLEDAFLVQKSFASSAAHELKTPLAVIKSSLQVVEMNPDPAIEDYQEFMEDTAQGLERIIKTVDGLLSLANLAAAPVDQRVEIEPLLLQAGEELAGKAAAGNVKISIADSIADSAAAEDGAGQERAAVQGNPQLLYRAFYNLMENAVKYNQPGGHVSVVMERKDTHIAVCIKDNGIGMENAALSHVFEPFYREDASRSQKIPGYGLGLTTVKMILERHGGSIEAVSEKGKGSEFIVRLPYDPAV